MAVAEVSGLCGIFRERVTAAAEVSAPRTDTAQTLSLPAKKNKTSDRKQAAFPWLAAEAGDLR